MSRKTFDEFGQSLHVGEIIFPSGMKSEEIKSILKEFFATKAIDTSHVMDLRSVKNICTYAPRRSQHFSVVIYPIVSSTNTEMCIRFLQSKEAVPLGVLGLTFIRDFDNLPKDVRLLSFLSYEVGERLSALIKHDNTIAVRDSVIRPYYDGLRHKGECLVAFVK